MKLTAEERTWLAAVADALIPATGAMPAASQAAVLEYGLAKVLGSRADLEPKLRELITAGINKQPDEYLFELKRAKPSDFSLLAETIAGAYFQDERVRALLGYSGQQPKRIDQDEEIDPVLLDDVRKRGPIYRPTPPR